MSTSILLPPSNWRRFDNRSVLWLDVPGLVPYDETLERMLVQQQALIDGAAREQVWLIESPAGYSRGYEAKDAHGPPANAGVPIDGLQVRHAGGFWFHGPGVLGVITLLDLRQRRKDVNGAIAAVESWLAATVDTLGVAGAHLRPDAPGVWVADKKIGTAVLRLRQWCTSFGGALCVDPVLARFNAIRTCGDVDCTVTSLAEQGYAGSMQQVRAAARAQFEAIFGSTTTGELAVP